MGKLLIYEINKIEMEFEFVMTYAEIIRILKMSNLQFNQLFLGFLKFLRVS